MTNPIEKITSKKPWLKFLGNRYFLVSLFFVVWMLFLDNYSYLDHRVLNKEIDELEDNKSYYQEEIKKDKGQIKKLKNPAQIEKYAREKYYMKRENEDIYIIEFEGDTIEKN
ncbi:FtsB family cell division protein [Flavobacterium terrae]|uniref:Septum formation initiator n=1 Tax=Flavobacterium terrae TaxID=415425 RepID=A0A1M6D5H0_9FLAO|nr:septum formation initiator family protein [Flavobacterium terrae]SHI68353.1 Septum formation initiator [Flavobacterium terrae]